MRYSRWALGGRAMSAMDFGNRMSAQKRNKRPLVTFALIAFSQEAVIREAVEAALAQEYEPLEIILSDDCSADHTFEIMQDVCSRYIGPHTIVLNRNPVNLGARGIGLHVNRVLELSQGDLVVFAAGDDVSIPQRTSTLVDTWLIAGKPDGSIHSAVEVFSNKREEACSVAHGNKDFGQQSIRECIRNGATGVLGASHAITRSIFERFGPLPEGTLFEDRTLAFRSLLIGKVLYCPKALVRYRRHGDNISGNEIYTDQKRWARWVDGMMAKYRSFLADYELVTPASMRDKRVITEIRRGLQRAECSRPLVSGSAFKRALAAMSYSAGLKLSDRIAFVLQRGGFEDTLAYRMLSTLWRAKQRFLRSSST